MGVVWQARDERLHRLVAVKQLLMQPTLSPADTDGIRQRALREARIAARLQHPNAIVVYDVAEHEGEPCLVMEYLPSRTLAEVLAEKGCLPVSEVASIGSQVASALGAAHDAQIVHRDVKPSNILIADGGTAKITDFGVSRAAGDVTLTQTGMMAGTPAYLAPEVARGQVPTPASDVFSLGATLFAAIEGRAPFGDGENQLALLHAVAAGEVEPPRNAGPLTATLMTLLAKDPSTRPGMHQASRELAAAMNPGPVHVTPPVQRRATPALPGSPPQTLAHPVAPPSPTPLVSAAPLPASAGSSPTTSVASPAAPPPGPPKRPGPATRQEPDPRRRAGILAAAAIVVLALVGGGAVLFGQSSQDRVATSGGSAPPVAPASPPASPSPSPPAQTSAASPPPTPPDLAGGPIGWSNAGQLVIDYYNGLDDPSSAWQRLSPAAQATFGSEAEFASYWSQYSSVSGRDAYGVTVNQDGSVTVPVTVTYQTDGGQPQEERRSVRVSRLDGRLLIDSDPR